MNRPKPQKAARARRKTINKLNKGIAKKKRTAAKANYKAVKKAGRKPVSTCDRINQLGK